MAGRPTKLTHDVAKRIVALVDQGNYLETAAAAVGINKTTIHDWMRRGARESKGQFREFSHLVETALARAEVADLKRIGAASRDQWQAAAWRLERKFPHRWGRREHHEHTGKDRGPIEVATRPDLSRLSDDELAEFKRLLFRAAPLVDSTSQPGGEEAGTGESATQIPS